MENIDLKVNEGKSYSIGPVAVAAQLSECVYWKKRTDRLYRAYDVISGVCRALDISQTLLLDRKGRKDYYWPRQIAMFLLHEYCPHLSLQGIGKFVNRDHSTVHHATIKVADRIATDILFRQMVERARLQIGFPRDAS